MDRIADTEIVERLKRSLVSGSFLVEAGGGEIPLLIRQRMSPVMVVVFAGAVDRKTLSIPRFASPDLAKEVSATVVHIADPSLALDPELTTAWYAGHKGFELQRILPVLLRAMAEACGARRMIFVGSSAGGFAALYYGWTMPKSIVLAMNAKTTLEERAGILVNRYRTICWPKLGEDEPLSEVVVSDLKWCYENRFENTVIYLQNAADNRHVRRHFAPFVAAVKEQQRLLPRLSYWGKRGHAPVPPTEWLPWLRAAIEAPTVAAEDIQQQRREWESERGSPAREGTHEEDYALAEELVRQIDAKNANEVSSVSL